MPGIVRWDWHFRETLPAIDDWEALFAQIGGEGDWTALLPVPAPGSAEVATAWPNPIPAPRIPWADETADLRLHGEGERIVLVTSAAAAAGAEEQEKRTLEPDEAVTGYRHPGGGDHDMWYHGYTRGFDRFSIFKAVPAPFALSVPAPLDLRPGRAEVPLELRSVVDRQLQVEIRAELRTRNGEPRTSAQTATIAPRAGAEIRLPVVLDRPGGALVLLTLAAEGREYRVPFLAHVEVVAPVLASVAALLAERPDAAAAAEHARLVAEESSLLGAILDGTARPAAWRTLFEAASALRDRLLLSRIDFDALVFAKQKPFISEQPYMDAHHLYNVPGGGIYRLSPVRPDGEVRPIVDTLGEGIYRDLCLSWDARRLLFSFGQGSDDWDPKAQSYHIYEIGVDGTGLRQLTFGPKNDCEPFYLPDGRIGFTSDRPEHYVLCGGPRHASLLFAMDADGSRLDQLSFNVVNDFNPSVLPDGRIIYTRWEYNERSVTSLHSLFTMLPDGSKVAPYYGNQSIRPNVLMFPRAVPNSSKVLALLIGHHGQTHGPLGLIDTRIDTNGMDAVEVLNPGMPVIGEKIEDSRVGWAGRAWPLSEETLLVTYTPTVVPWRERSWAIYVADRRGAMALVCRDPAISTSEPIPLVPTPRPHVVPASPASSDRADFGALATVLLIDAYAGQPAIERGAVRSLRIIEDVPRKGVHVGGVIPVSATSMYTVKRHLGQVPVEADGSAHFTVAANRPVYFSLVDERGLEIQRMRSSLCFRPGEVQTCIGCHEPRHTAPPVRGALPRAARRPASAPEPPPWGLRRFSYLRDIQPVLDAHCSACHARGRAKNGVLLTGELTDQYAVSYEELLASIKTAYATRWDVPYDVYRVPPRDFGSGASQLMRLLDGGHHGVALSAAARTALILWIDANGVYYGWYADAWNDRHIFTGRHRKPLEDVFERRCARCHGDGDGRVPIHYPILNHRDPERTSIVLGPLAATAGGWGACQGDVFGDRDDPDYARMVGALRGLAAALAERPRQDLVELAEPDPAAATAAR